MREEAELRSKALQPLGSLSYQPNFPSNIDIDIEINMFIIIEINIIDEEGEEDEGGWTEIKSIATTTRISLVSTQLPPRNIEISQPCDIDIFIIIEINIIIIQILLIIFIALVLWPEET